MMTEPSSGTHLSIFLSQQRSMTLVWLSCVGNNRALTCHLISDPMSGHKAMTTTPGLGPNICRTAKSAKLPTQHTLSAHAPNLENQASRRPSSPRLSRQVPQKPSQHGTSHMRCGMVCRSRRRGADDRWWFWQG